jgi:hypothetical protein
MKILKLAVVYMIILSANPIFAQNESDVLRFSQTFAGATARSIGMSGAFGALGGDMSSLSINPAGIGVYRVSEFTFTPELGVDNTKSTFLGSKYSDSKYRLNMSNVGYVYTYNSNKEEGWVTFSFGIAYNRMNDFNRNATILSVNQHSSMLDGFTDYLNANYLGMYTNAPNPIGTTEDLGPVKNDLLDRYPNYEYLAFMTGVVWPDQGNNVNPGYFINNFQAAGTYGETQQRTITTKGKMGEWAFSIGSNYSNKLFIGATFGAVPVDYEEEKSHTESNIPGDLDRFTFYEKFKTNGTGYNGKFGVIYKPIDFIRLGFAFHTPTFYNMTSEFYTSLDANYSSPPFNNSTKTHYNEEASSTSYNYTITSPLKLVGSFALQFKQFGVLSADYEFIDYSTAKIRGSDDALADLNGIVQNSYKATSNIKLGAEAKLGDFAIRGGYGFYGSPYSSSEFNKGASTTSYSLGAGYRGKSFFLDFGYIMFATKYKHKLYDYANLTPSYGSEIADMDSKYGRFVTTLGFRF